MYSFIIKDFYMRERFYLNLYQCGSVTNYFMHLFDAGLEAEDILITRFNLTQCLSWNLSVRVDLWKKKKIIIRSHHVKAVLVGFNHLWHRVLWDSTNIRSEDGRIVTVQHHLQLFFCYHFTNWNRLKNKKKNTLHTSNHKDLLSWSSTVIHFHHLL